MKPEECKSVPVSMLPGFFSVTGDHFSCTSVSWHHNKAVNSSCQDVLPGCVVIYVYNLVAGVQVIDICQMCVLEGVSAGQVLDN